MLFLVIVPCTELSMLLARIFWMLEKDQNKGVQIWFWSQVPTVAPYKAVGEIRTKSKTVYFINLQILLKQTIAHTYDYSVFHSINL